jgi:hypothetical protein
VACTAAILFGCGSGGSAPSPIIVPSGPTGEAPQPVAVTLPPQPSTDATAPAPPAETAPPPADFFALAYVVQAGPLAIGKMVRLRARRGYTSGTRFLGVPCLEDPPSTHLFLDYKPEQRDWARAMAGTPSDACATVSFRVIAFRGGVAPVIEGSIEHIGTVKPKQAATPSRGADYASIDDAILAGADAQGKIIAGDFLADRGNPKEIRLFDCKRSDAMVLVISKTPAQQALADQLPESPGACGRAHLRMTDPNFVARKGDSVTRPRADVVSVP